jgi:hypothetical protein
VKTRFPEQEYKAALAALNFAVLAPACTLFAQPERTTCRNRVVLISNRTPKPARALGSRANTMTPDLRLGAQSSAQ